jgi:hypothetical protein
MLSILQVAKPHHPVLTGPCDLTAQAIQRSIMLSQHGSKAIHGIAHAKRFLNAYMEVSEMSCF